MRNFELVSKSEIYSSALNVSSCPNLLYNIVGKDCVFGADIYEGDYKFLYYHFTCYNRSFLYRVRFKYFCKHSFFYILSVLERDLFKRGLIPERYKSL